MILFCCLWMIKKTQRRVWKSQNPWDQNMFHKIIRNTVQIANKSNCCAYAHLPEHAEKGISLAIISWRSLWARTNLKVSDDKGEGNTQQLGPVHSFPLLNFIFFPLIRSEMEKEIMNISATLQVIENKSTDVIHAWQKEVPQAGMMALQNRKALDTSLAWKGGVCNQLTLSCCLYVDQSGRISTDAEDIWKQIKNTLWVSKRQYSSWIWRDIKMTDFQVPW